MGSPFKPGFHYPACGNPVPVNMARVENLKSNHKSLTSVNHKVLENCQRLHILQCPLCMITWSINSITAKVHKITVKNAFSSVQFNKGRGLVSPVG